MLGFILKVSSDRPPKTRANRAGQPLFSLLKNSVGKSEPPAMDSILESNFIILLGRIANALKDQSPKLLMEMSQYNLPSNSGAIEYDD